MLVEDVYRRMGELDDIPGDTSVYLVNRYESSNGFPHDTDLVIDTATFDEERAECRTDELYDNRERRHLAFWHRDTTMEEVRDREDFTLEDLDTITKCLVEESQAETDFG